MCTRFRWVVGLANRARGVVGRRWAAGRAFLAGDRNANTRTAELQQLHRWFAWCTAYQLDPLAVERTHVELYLRWFER